MRRTLFLSLFLNASFLSNAQYHTHINFDDTVNFQYLTIDSISNPNNLWQIGAPQKTTFVSAYSIPNVIVTDTINSYPINDTSSFILFHVLHFVDQPFGFVLSGRYFSDTDSLNDFGKIEFSPDNGLSWVLISDDTATYSQWGSIYNWPKNIYNLNLTGNSGGWQHFSIVLEDYYSMFDGNIGDTVLFKFTFISDGNLEFLDGIMFDNLSIIENFIGGTGENETQPLHVYPNPVHDFFTIQLDANENCSFVIYVYDASGKLLLIKETTAEQTLKIDCRELDKGMYHFRVDERNGEPVGKGKFIKG